MKSKHRLSFLAISCFAASISQSVVQADGGFKCYGISLRGKNACNALDHNDHSCGGESKRDRHIGDWTVVQDAAECKKLGGLSESEARKKLGLPSA